MYVKFLSRAFVIHKPRTKPERKDASFRVYLRLLTASTNASASASLHGYTVQARLRNECVLLFNPLKFFRIMALTPGTLERCANILRWASPR